MEQLRRISRINKYVVTLVACSNIKTALMPLWGKKNKSVPGAWTKTNEKVICNVWDLNPEAHTYLFPTNSVEHVVIVIDGDDDNFDIKQQIVELFNIQKTYSSWNFIIINGYEGTKIPSLCAHYEINNFSVINADLDMKSLQDYVLKLSEKTIDKRMLEAHRNINKLFLQ